MELRSTQTFDAFLNLLTLEQQKSVVRSLVQERERIGALPAGPSRARRVHALVEEAQARFQVDQPELLSQVRCGKGCTHCCHVWVGITKDEAELLADKVRTGTARPDPERMELQSRWESPLDFLGKPREQSACVFLGPDGACTVYEDRPSICRSLLVVSDPELCRLPDDTRKTSPVSCLQVELLVSAALSVDAEDDPPPAFGRPLARTLRTALAGGRTE